MRGDLFKDVIRSLRHLKSLHVPCYTWVQELEGLNLEVLVLSCVYLHIFDSERTQVWGTLRHMPSLKSLRLMYTPHWNGFSEPLVDLTTVPIETLEMTGSTRLQDRDVFVGPSTSLRNFICLGSFSIESPDRWFTALGSRLRRLSL